MLKETPEVLSVGHLPPPITGENLCRARFEEVLQRDGWKVAPRRRSLSPEVWISRAKLMIVVAGASLSGTGFDMLFTSWQLLRGKQVALYFHNRSWERYRTIAPIWRRIGKDKVLAVVLTEQIAASLRRWGLRVEVIENTAGSDFESLVARGGHSSRRLLWMGRADDAKGFDIALKAFRILREQNEEWVFDVYGAVSEKFSSNTERGVRFFGFVNGTEKASAFLRGGVFILPSRYREETQPLAIIEAFGSGLPVVASDVGGIAEMLRPTSVGISPGELVSGEDSEEYAAAVKRCVANYKAYSTAANDRYWTSYSQRMFDRRVRTVCGLKKLSIS